jgi:predicted enzyme related to lactoylglutathione lyase
MPYDIVRNGPGCNGGYAVVGPSGAHGCHKTRGSAIQQQRALYAAEADGKKVVKAEEWEGKPLYDELSDAEQMLADSLLKLAQEAGPLDKAEGIWVGYVNGANNENASIGVKCGNCALHKSSIACAILEMPIEEEGACRFAVIPDGYVTVENDMDDMENDMDMANNIGSYFEIPVTDMERAISFYQTLLGIELEQGSIDEYEMAFFPYENNGVGISGALVKGDVYKPSIDGVFLYLKTDDIDLIIRKAVDLGSEILLEKTKGDSYFVAEIKDSEGNRICFKQDFSVNVSNDGEENIMNDDFDMSKASLADLDLRPTESMANNARRGLELRRKFGRGGTAVGVARARDLMNRSKLSPSTVLRMYSFFSRHEVDKQGKDWNNSERPSNGKIAWLLWGGDSGYAWAKSKRNAIMNIRSQKSDGMWIDSPFSLQKYIDKTDFDL